MAFFTEDFLRFFIELAPNNNKEWFDANRKRYETVVKKPFADFVTHVIQRIAKNEPEFKDIEAKDCIFRINRDIRFSKDKSPYKLNVSAVVAPSGKKSKAINGVYFEFSPEHVRVYGGIYEIEKEDLYLIREGISQHLNQFKQLYTAPSFQQVYGKVLGEKNKVVPAEFKEAAEKEALIYNKQWYFFKEFDAETVLQDNLDELILACYEAGKPIEHFFNSFINRK